MVPYLIDAAGQESKMTTHSVLRVIWKPHTAASISGGSDVATQTLIPHFYR